MSTNERSDVFSLAQLPDQGQVLCEQRFRSIVENSPDIILVVDESNTIQYINFTAHDYVKSEVVFKSIFDFAVPSDHAMVRKANRRAFKTGAAQNYVMRVITPAETIVYYQVKVKPLDTKGKAGNLAVIARDITEEVLAKRELKDKTLQLERKNIALTELLAHIEDDRNKLKSQIYTNLEMMVRPLISDLKNNALQLDKKLLEVLEETLTSLTKEVFTKQDQITLSLSPKEMQICVMMKNGLSVKEIAKFYSRSERTIEKHRENIRKKLNIHGTSINLVTQLRTLKI